MDEKEKWTLNYDRGSKHCGYMISNMTEIFNSILEEFDHCLSQQYRLSHSTSVINGS
jgi:hypothetical protein